MLKTDQKAHAPATVDQFLHRRQQLWMAAVTLLLVDLMLFIANIVHLASNNSHEPTSMFSGWMWNGDYDRSHIEMFAHVQVIAGAVMLAFLAVNRRSLVFAAWSFAFAVLFIDDFFRIHEDMGGFLRVYEYVGPAAGLRAQDVGELVILGIEGAVVGAFLLFAFLRASRADRRHSLHLVGLFGVLAVFAVGVDQVHALLEPHVSTGVSAALAFAETGGELIGMTLLALAVYRMTLSPEPTAPDRDEPPNRDSALMS